ncbi:hypothetical protein EG329_009157 [Mollisiaceae sp. DMI_Dod_QoI]|nr:hypothetical protein EG329_009157 [Helotiales sp. DMI_Dod_QoI]
MGDASAPKGEYILVCLPFPKDSKIDEILEGIKKRHPDTEIEYHDINFTPGWRMGDNSVSEDAWRKVTILVTLTTLPPNLDIIKNLKLIHLASAGANHIAESPIWKDTDITLTNSSGVHGPQISEWVVMQILTNSHKEKLLVEWQKQHKWGKHTDVGTVRDSVGQRLGVLGYGAIGRQTARISKAMGMDVIAYTASPRTTPESKKDHGYIVPGTGDEDGLIPSAWYSGLDKVSLHNFLKQDIDILLISVPLTKETTHLLGAEELAILGKTNAFIVNIARGKVVDQNELIKALKKSPEDGGLRGAALDVTDPEPLPANSELWDLKNVAITPHVSGLGTTYANRTFEILERNLYHIENGEDLINVVDKKKGY